MSAKIKLKKVINHQWTKVVLHDNKIGYINNNDYRHVTEVKLDRERLVEYAQLFLNTNYRWGGKSILGIDCSGLVQLCYMLEGRMIYRNSHITDDILNEFQMERIDKSQLQPGDLIYAPRHVMMYIGNDLYIHASETQGKVVINSLNHKDERYLDYLDETTFNYVRCL